MDGIDLRILAELQQDGGIRNNELADRVLSRLCEPTEFLELNFNRKIR